jgi:hypothetical protein
MYHFCARHSVTVLTVNIYSTGYGRTATAICCCRNILNPAHLDGTYYNTVNTCCSTDWLMYSALISQDYLDSKLRWFLNHNCNRCCRKQWATRPFTALPDSCSQEHLSAGRFWIQLWPLALLIQNTAIAMQDTLQFTAYWPIIFFKRWQRVLRAVGDASVLRRQQLAHGPIHKSHRLHQRNQRPSPAHATVVTSDAPNRTLNYCINRWKETDVNKCAPFGVECIRCSSPRN